MLMILELGIWLIPLTLVLAPIRRFVLLISKIQQLHASMSGPRFSSPDMWSRLARLDTMTFIFSIIEFCLKNTKSSYFSLVKPDFLLKTE
ncbi:hypothetical protein FCM35_KLT14522 [Carex littledalei]|uniref:Uncharacterized protein n=1 Tax=Carex littledalei TaxID=544730 RepID=A0A833VE15_9POAL|nr:hypothetical protein FCM35_KLT14522 [Carex littledalei]